MTDLKNNNAPSFSRGEPKELETLLYLFMQLGWCKRGDSYLVTYTNLATAFDLVKENIYQIIYDVIKDTDKMKEFLIVHSAFSHDIEDRNDPLELFMYKLLQPTEEEKKWLTSLPEVPKEIIDKLDVLGEVEPIAWLRDPIRIEYKLWGKKELGESYQPINIIDIDLEEYDKNQFDIKDFISQYDVIKM